MYAKLLREQLSRISGQLNDITAKCKQEGNRGLKPEEREAFDKLVDDYTNIEASIKRAEKADSITDHLAQPGGRISETALEEIQDSFRLSPSAARARKRANDPHARAFTSFLRGGIERLEPGDRSLMAAKFENFGGGFRNAQSGAVGSQGGYLVPQGFSDELEEAMKWFGGIEGTVRKFKTATGNPMPYPTVNDTTNKGRIIGQDVQVTETDFVFGQVTFNAYIGSSDLVLIPLALMEDSYFDIDQLTARMLGTRLGRLYNNMCTVGTGTAQPNGIVTAATTAGNIYTCPTGETTSVSYTDLVNLEHSVDPAYRNNPSSYWMFSDAMLKGLKKLVDGNNRPLWQPGLTASFGRGAGVNLTPGNPMILDHQYVINDDMATPAANAYTMLFGDMSTFVVRELESGTTLMRLVERYADYLQVGFIGYRRFDSQLVDAGTHPVAVLQQSAS